MPRDGAGNHSLPYPDFQPGTIIDQAQVDANFADVSAALSASLARNGEAAPTANQPMGNFRHTSVGNAQARTDYAAAGQVQDGSLKWAGNTNGTGAAYTCTLVPAITALVNGLEIGVRLHAANDASPTLNLNGLGAKPIQMAIRGNYAALPASVLALGAVVTLCYSQAQDAWVLTSPISYAPEWVEITQSMGSTPVSATSFGLPSSFLRFKLVWMDVVPSIQAQPYIRFSYDSGASYKSGATDYTAVGTYARSAAPGTPGAVFVQQSYMPVAPSVQATWPSHGCYEFTATGLQYGVGAAWGVNSPDGDTHLNLSGRMTVGYGTATNVLFGAFGANLNTHRVKLFGMLP